MTLRKDNQLNDEQRRFMDTFGKMSHGQSLSKEHKQDFFEQIDSMMEKGKFTQFFKDKFSLPKSLLKLFIEKNDHSNDDANWFNS